MLANLFLFISLNGLVGWSSLSDLTFKLRYEEQFGEKVEIPVFGPKLRQLDGKAFTVSGYFIPADIDGNIIILSKIPYSSCFFCGGAGIDSVIEIHFDEKPRRYKPDEVVKATGTLELNDSDFEHLIFMVKNAKEIR